MNNKKDELSALSHLAAEAQWAIRDGWMDTPHHYRFVYIGITREANKIADRVYDLCEAAGIQGEEAPSGWERLRGAIESGEVEDDGADDDRGRGTPEKEFAAREAVKKLVAAWNQYSRKYGGDGGY